MLFLKIQIILIQFLRILFGNMFKPKLKYLSGPLILPLPDLKLWKFNKILLLQCLGPQLSYNSLIHPPSIVFIFALLLHPGNFNIGLHCRKSFKVLIHNCLSFFSLAHSLLEFHISHPSFLSWLPLHPSLENVPSFSVLSYCLLHVSVFEPELVLTGQVVSGSFPQIPSMVNKSIFKFHFRVLKPNTGISVIDLESTFENRSCTSEFF